VRFLLLQYHDFVVNLLPLLTLTIPQFLQQDLHDKSLSRFVFYSPLSPYSQGKTIQSANICTYDLHVYPSQALLDSYKTRVPMVYTTIIGCVFFVIALAFFIFNRYIQLRNHKVVLAAAKSNKIVSTIFPSNVRDRLFNNEETHGDYTNNSSVAVSGIKDFLKSGVRDETETSCNDLVYRELPIADLFPEVSVY
jgi:hypothetical protein